MDAEAYLRRIEYSGPRAPDATTLRALHLAHLMTVPFENLSIHAGERIVLSPGALFEKIVTRRRGGFCYELNGLFAGLLRALGFNVSFLSAGVLGESGDFGPEFDHMALLVSLEERWLADVGFGDSFLEPLRLDARGPQREAAGVFRIHHEAGGDWRVLMRWAGDGSERPQYRFTTAPRTMGEFEPMCRYHQTSPDSPFTRKRLCTKVQPGGRLTLTGLRLVTTEGGDRRERELTDDQEYVKVLRESFGIELTH